jgi:hypothetical protein
MAGQRRIFHAGFQPIWPAGRMEYALWQGSSCAICPDPVQPCPQQLPDLMPGGQARQH